MMSPDSRERALRVFFGLAACSWVPHWSCHYYRIETGSTFVVGGWSLSELDSVVSLFAYGALIGTNLLAIASAGLRIPAAVISGLLHLVIGVLHLYRLAAPFRFEVFGYGWPASASLREAAVVLPFGAACLWVALLSRRLH